MLTKLADLLQTYLNVDLNKVSDTTILNTLEDWDSMAHMTLIMKLEEEYEFMLSGDEIVSLQTIGDIKQLISKKIST
jgi:acyl carrier protein